jgi:hypothetical protein
MKAPKDLLENKKFRAKLLQKAEKDKELRKVLWLKCKNDDKFFIDTFCWTFDPRLSDPVVPFILYPRQEAFIDKLNEWLERSRNGEKINAFVDKPRAVGATFTFMTWALHKFLFDDFSCRVGSRKEDYVDKKGEQDTLFYKLDFNLERLPRWLLPKGFNMENHRARMILKSPAGTNTISGESANPNFGRGGRKSVTMFDEHGFWEWARSSWESAGESTNFRIAMTTPPETGQDSHAYKLRTQMMGKVEVFEFQWSDVPSRDNLWLQQARENKSDEELAREVLKSYEGTTEGKVYAVDFRFAELNDVDYDPYIPLFVWWDFGLDTVAMIWAQKNMETGKLRIIDSYSNENKAIDFYVPFVTGVVASGIHQYTEFEEEMIQRHKDWSKTRTHFGDPDVKKRAVKDAESTYDVLKKYGIDVQFTDWAGRQWQDLKEKTKLSFRRLEINEARNEKFISAMRNAKYPKKREGSQATSEPLKPVHDWTSHFRSAYEYGIDNEPDSIGPKKAVVSYPTPRNFLMPNPGLNPSSSPQATIVYNTFKRR